MSRIFNFVIRYLNTWNGIMVGIALGIIAAPALYRIPETISNLFDSEFFSSVMGAVVGGLIALAVARSQSRIDRMARIQELSIKNEMTNIDELLMTTAEAELEYKSYKTIIEEFCARWSGENEEEVKVLFDQLDVKKDIRKFAQMRELVGWISNLTFNRDRLYEQHELVMGLINDAELMFKKNGIENQAELRSEIERIKQGVEGVLNVLTGWNSKALERKNNSFQKYFENRYVEKNYFE